MLKLCFEENHISCTYYHTDRIPLHVRKEDERAFRPMIASIGHFYYSTPDLQDMEAQKLKFLHHMLKENDKLDLLSCLHGAMKELETQSRKFYLEDFSRINSDDFVQIMLVGGTFIIELFHLNAKVNKDLLMIENQLPLFELHEIFRLTGCSTEEDGSSLNRLSLQFFEPLRPGGDKMPIESCKIEGNYQHLLTLFQSSFIPNDYHPEPALRRSLSNKYRDLPMKGNSTKLVLRNLLAYEQCNSCVAPYFTSLVLLFSSLINTEKDVELLRGGRDYQRRTKK
ncbi:hypothetical protein REPUB_Repub18cG0061700 [Reevesia pubescens]